MSLYRKYRPTEFDEIVGNESLIDSIQGMLSRKHKKIPRTWLFDGPSGCGKTSLARLVADKVGIDPLDLAEYDVADMRGIDFIRDLRRKMHLSPMVGAYRGYILDEAHSLTKEAQNALLKAAEDTPDHVFFFLATTDPNKIIKTLLNRATRFSVSPLSSKEMSFLLKGVAEAEGKEVPKETLKMIHRESLGSPRAALVILDKIIDLDEDQHESLIEKAAAEQEQAIELCRALMNRKKWKTVAKILKDLKDQDPESIRRMMMAYTSNVLLSKGDANSFLILDVFKEPFYNSGFPGLVAACYDILEG